MGMKNLREELDHLFIKYGSDQCKGQHSYVLIHYIQESVLAFDKALVWVGRRWNSPECRGPYYPTQCDKPHGEMACESHGSECLSPVVQDSKGE